MSIEEKNTPGIETFEVELEGQELGIGLKIPTSVKTPVSYLDSLRKYKDIYNDIYQQMEVANKLYRYDPIIGNGVDVLVDFAVTKVRPQPTNNKKLDEVLEFWFENVNSKNSNSLRGVYPLAQEIGLEWFTSGNAFPYNKWDNVQVKETTYKLPYSINLINPQSIHIPLGPIAFGQEMIYLKYDADLISKLRSDGRADPEAALIKQAIPRSVLKSLQNPSNSNVDGIRLNPRYVSHIKRRAKGYQAWGIPYLSRCFSSASLLEKLKELDSSITSGLINLITIFKIGTDQFPASQARLQQFAALFSNPKATQTLVWAHDIELIQVGPDGKVLAFRDKYKQAKEDILIAMGVPPVLMSLDQSGDEWVSILSLVERLTHWRSSISIWLEDICNQIAEFNGFSETVKVKWDRMNLTDEQSIKNLVLAFYDRGLLSIDTTLKESNYNIKTEIQAKKAEKDIKEEFLPPDLPFSSKTEVSKDRPNDSDPKMSNKTKKKDSTKPESVVNDKPLKNKPKPKAPGSS